MGTLRFDTHTHRVFSALYFIRINFAESLTLGHAIGNSRVPYAHNLRVKFSGKLIPEHVFLNFAHRVARQLFDKMNGFGLFEPRQLVGQLLRDGLRRQV